MATSVTPSGYTFFKNSSTGVSSVVGYESSSERGIRYTFKLPSSCSAGATSYSFSKSNVGGLGGGSAARWNWAVSEDSSAYLNTTAAGDGYKTSVSGTFSGSANKTLYPGKTYYLFIYPGSTKYGWRYWNYPGSITLTVDGSITYTVTYDKGAYGSGSIAAGTQTYGAAFTITSSTFTRTGYTQTGWSYNNDDGTKEYNIGQSLAAGYGFGSSCTLYPTWVANNYKLTFNANGGTNSPGGNFAISGYDVSYGNGTTTSYVTVTYDNSNFHTMTGNIPVRAGYRFLGWYTAASGGTQVYTELGNSTNNGTYWNSSGYWNSASNQTVYAHWERIEYTISFDANGGTVNPASQVIGYPNGNYNSLPTPINSGKKFTGWFVDIGNNGPINLGKEYKYPSSSGLTIAFEAYMEDWSTISTATLISCTEGGGWNLWFNNGTLMSEIMTTSSTSYKLIYPGRSGLKASDLKSGWHTFSIAISNTNGIVIEVDKKYLGIESCSGLKYADVASLWLGAEASPNPNSHGGNIFPGLIRNFTIENRATTGIDPIVGSFAIPDQNIILYADWESTNVMFIKVNGQWKCGQTAIKLDGQWVGIEGATMEVEKNIL